MIKWLVFIEGFITMIPTTILALIYFGTFKYNGILITGKRRIVVIGSKGE